MRAWLCVLVVLALGGLAWGQEVPAALVGKADIIVQGTVFRVTPGEGGVTLQLGLARNGNLKGPESLARLPIFVPAERKVTFEKTPENCILFLSHDAAKQRNVLLDDPAARQGFNRELADAIRKLAAQHRGVTVTFATEKPSYTCGELVTLVWTFTNTADQPVRIYTGPYAFQWDTIVDGARSGTGSGGTHSRKETDYRTLAPGETFIQRQPLRKFRDVPDSAPTLFPEGPLGLNMVYECTDNWLGSHDRNITGRVENVAFLREEKRFEVPILPPDQQALDALVKQLASPVWMEQQQAMQILANSKQTAALPAVRALAQHPSPALRLLAANALTLTQPSMNPALEGLLFDPARVVRDQAAQYCGRRDVPDSTLPLYTLLVASREALEKGYLPDGNNLAVTIGVTLNNRADARLGDVLCARLEAGTDDGALLNRLLPAEQRLPIRGEWKPTDEQKKQLAAAWKASKPTEVKCYTTAEFDALLAKVRAAAFQNFTLDPRLPQVRTLLQKLTQDFGSFGRDSDVEALAAMGKEIAPTIVFILRNSYVGEYDSGAVCALLRRWQVTEAGEYLLSRAVAGNRYAAPAAAALVPALARPQLEALYTKNQAAAVALGQLGDQRALPFIFTDRFAYEGDGWSREELAALTTLTGKVKSPQEWRQWWKDEGSKNK